MRQGSGKRGRRRPLRFTKMHGLGNDFVVVDLVSQHFHIDARVIKRLADRRFGVGCDQVDVGGGGSMERVYSRTPAKIEHGKKSGMN